MGDIKILAQGTPHETPRARFLILTVGSFIAGRFQFDPDLPVYKLVGGGSPMP